MEINTETVDKRGFGLFVRLGTHPLVVNTRESDIAFSTSKYMCNLVPVCMQTAWGLAMECN